MRFSSLLFTTTLLMAACSTAMGQVKAIGIAQAPAVPAKKENADEPFDQMKSDQELLRSAGIAGDTTSLVDFFKKHTTNEADKARLAELVKKLGDDSFDTRQAASKELSQAGVAAIAILRNELKNPDFEIARRSELALKIIEKVPTRSLAMAAARILAKQPADGITEALLNYLPLAEDESVADEIRNTLTALAIRNGKSDAILEAAIESRDLLKRGAAAEAFTRVNNKESRDRMKQLFQKEGNADIKALIALSLVQDAREKASVPQLIKLVPDISTDKAWRVEELLWRIAGEDGPPVSLGSDPEARKKARDEWQKWWDKHEAKLDLAKLDQESSYGLTIVCETPTRGGMGRIVALGGDNKERWNIPRLNYPMDAVILAGKKILIAEHSRNRIVEKSIDDKEGKDNWFETINQPVNVGKLPNGVVWAVGRNQIIEWERGDKSNKKQIFTFTRNEYDIVAGMRMKNGDYVLLSQNQQIFVVDRKKNTVTKSHAIPSGGGVNYYSSIDITPTGKILIPLLNSIIEMDLESGKQTWTATFQNPSSAQRLRNGNTLVAAQNRGKLMELDKDGKPTKWEYTCADSYRPIRAFKR